MPHRSSRNEYQTSGLVIGGVSSRPVFHRDVFVGPWSGLSQSYVSPNVVWVLKSHLYIGRSVL